MSRDGLTANEKFLLVAMTLHTKAAKGNTMWHSYKSLARETGMSDSTVRRAAKSLEDKGLIQRKPRFVVRSGETKPARTSDLVTVLVGCGQEMQKSVAVEVEDDPLVTVPTGSRQSDKGAQSHSGEAPPTVTAQNKEVEQGKEKFSNQIRPTSPSPSSPAPVDDSCLLEGPGESGEPDTAEAFDELDRLQANEHTPETPDYLAGLDDFAPLEPTETEDWEDDWEPIGDSQPDQPDNVGRIKAIHEENDQAHPEAPTAALARFRNRGHPARAQELASTIANGLRFPA